MYSQTVPCREDTVRCISSVIDSSSIPKGEYRGVPKVDLSLTEPLYYGNVTSLDSLEDVGIEPPDNIDIDELVVMQQAVREAVDKMTDWQRTVMYLHLVGFSFTWVANTYHRTHRSPRDAYERALRYLHDALL